MTNSPACRHILATVPFLCGLADAQPTLYGLTYTGEFITIDPATGQAQPVRQLPSPYNSYCDSLVYAYGHFYASYGSWPGGGNIVQFDLPLGTEVNLGSSGSPHVEDMFLGPDGEIYASYDVNNSTMANAIGRLDVQAASCSLKPVCNNIPGFFDIDAISFDDMGRFWLANLAPQSQLGRLDLQSCTLTHVARLPFTRLIAFVPTGSGSIGAGEFYGTYDTSDFGPSRLVRLHGSGAVSFDVPIIGPTGPYQSVAGLAMVPQVGTQPGGAGASGCRGRQELAATAIPRIGHPTFGLSCNQAPPSAPGLLLLGDRLDPVGSDPLRINVLLHVDLRSTFLLFAWAFSSDSQGRGTATLPIPLAPNLVGAQLATQAMWLWPTAACSLPPVQGSSSNGLLLTIQ